MTLDNRLTTAAADTRDRISGLTPRMIRGRRRWTVAAAGAVAVAVLAAVSIAVVMNLGNQAGDESIAASGSPVEASLLPTAAPGQPNRATELASIGGRAVSDLEVRSIVVDDTGTLWLAVAEPSQEGRPRAARLYSFDGREWRSLDAPHPGYWGVLAGNEDALWVDTWEGIARFDGESWEHFTLEDGVPRSSISSAAIAPNGGLWLYSNGLLVAASLDESPRWEEHSRVTVFDGTKWDHWDAVEEESMELGFLALDADGAPWIASSGARWGDGEPGGVWKLEDQTWVQAWQGTKPVDFFSAIAVDDHGDVWAAYREFVLHLTDGGAELADATDGIGRQSDQQAAINWQPTAIAIGDADVVWVATMGGGVSRFDGTAWNTFDEGNGLPSSEIADIELARDGRLWLRAGREGQRVIAFDPDD